MDLLNSQKKEIFDLIVYRNFEPNSFELVINHNDFTLGIPVLTYKDTKYFFAFNSGDIKGQSYGNSIFSPGKSVLVQMPPYNSWPDQCSNFYSWLDNLERELSIKNPWENIKDYLPSNEIDFRDKDINSEFSFQEVAQIEASLNNFKTQLLEKYTLSAEQIEIISRKIDYLCDTAKRSRKIDWKNIFVGSMINLMITINLSPEQAYAFWQTLMGCFVHLLNFR